MSTITPLTVSIKNNNNSMSYECKTSVSQTPYIVIDNTAYLQLTDRTTTGNHIKILSDGKVYRPTLTYTTTTSISDGSSYIDSTTTSSSTTTRVTSITAYSGVYRSTRLNGTSQRTTTTTWSGWHSETTKTLTLYSGTESTQELYYKHSLTNGATGSGPSNASASRTVSSTTLNNYTTKA